MAADPSDVAEAERLQRQLEQSSRQNDTEGIAEATESISELVQDEDKYALREELIQRGFIVSVVEALERQWPGGPRTTEDGDTELFETMSGLLVWFCQDINRYTVWNRVRFANESAKVIIPGLVLPESGDCFESAWDEMFQYIAPSVLKEIVANLRRYELDEGVLDSLDDKIDQARIGKGSYGRIDYLIDLPMAPYGLALDLSQVSGFLSKGDYLSLTILLFANLFKGLAAGFLCTDVEMFVMPNCLKPILGSSEKAGEIFWRVHNFFSFGVSGLVMQIQKAYENRQKNDNILRMVVFDSMKSSVSLIIAGQSMLNSNYSGVQVVIKWMSLLYSIYSISKTALKANKSCLYDYRHYIQHSTHKSNVVRKFIRQCSGSFALRAFHISEVLGVFVLLSAEYFQRYSLICILGAQLVVLVAGIFWYTKGKDERGVGQERWKLSFFAATYLWANPLLGVDSEKIAFNLFVVYVRPIPWIVAWCVVLLNATYDIPDYTKITMIVYLIMGAVGALIYTISSTFFDKMGLWLHNEDSSGV